MGRTVSFDIDGNDVTCMKEFDALLNSCDACGIEDCPDRETIIDIKLDTVHATHAATTRVEALERMGK